VAFKQADRDGFFFAVSVRWECFALSLMSERELALVLAAIAERL
jgi:hypothetical protein